MSTRVGVKIGPFWISQSLKRGIRSAYARHRDRQALLIFAVIGAIALVASMIH